MRARIDAQAMSAKPLTVGIVGLGYGRAHLVGFRAAGCDIVGAILNSALPDGMTLLDIAVDPPVLWEEQMALIMGEQ